MKVALVPREFVAIEVPKVKHLLKRAANETQGKYDVEDIVECVLSFEYDMWLVYDDNGICAVFLTRVLFYPRKRLLSVAFAAGDGFWIWREEIVRTMQYWAFDCDCDGIEVIGRRGWLKALAEFGVIDAGAYLEFPAGTRGIRG